MTNVQIISWEKDCETGSMGFVVDDQPQRGLVFWKPPAVDATRAPPRLPRASKDDSNTLNDAGMVAFGHVPYFGVRSTQDSPSALDAHGCGTSQIPSNFEWTAPSKDMLPQFGWKSSHDVGITTCRTDIDTDTENFDARS